MSPPTSPPESPSKKEWMVPAVLGAALVAIVAVAEVRKRTPSTSASPEPTAGETAPPAGPPSPAAPSANAPAQIEASHVLVMWQGSQRAPPNITRTKDEARVRVAEVLRRARAGEDFAGLAREFSDEPGAGERGGALGSFGRGMMVPPFEQAAFALQPGQVSDVVETAFGYHVIKRTR